MALNLRADIFVGTRCDGLFSSGDNPESWTTVNVDQGDYTFLSIAFNRREDIFVENLCAGGRRMEQSTDSRSARSSGFNGEGLDPRNGKVLLILLTEYAKAKRLGKWQRT